MTKLEEKLIELGYEIYLKDFNTLSKLAYKTINKYEIKLRLNKEITKIKAFGVVDDFIELYINSQEQIDNLQLAFNEMKRDLEMLKEYEVVETTNRIIKHKKKTGEMVCTEVQCNQCPLGTLNCYTSGLSSKANLYAVLDNTFNKHKSSHDNPIYKAYKEELDKEIEV